MTDPRRAEAERCATLCLRVGAVCLVIGFLAGAVALAGDTSPAPTFPPGATLAIGFFVGALIGLCAAEMDNWRGSLLILAAWAVVIWLMGWLGAAAHAGDTAGPALTEPPMRVTVQEVTCDDLRDCCGRDRECCPGCDTSPYPVPLPAPGLLLAAGIGIMLAMKRRAGCTD